MLRTSAIVLALLLTAACDGDEPLLVVDLKTDFVPGVEFQRVRTVLVAGSGGLDRSTDEPAAVGDAFVSGRRIAEIGGLSAGNIEMRVELLREDGGVVAVRPVRVDYSGRLAVTVLITRDCAGVVCPAPDGDSSATACLNRQCVNPSCIEERPETCGSVCEVASDCAGGSACATPVCVSGACLLDVEAARCGMDDYCHPELGCRPLAPEDAGPPPADTGPADTGPADTSTPPDAATVPACIDHDLGSAIGPSLATGSADGAGDDFPLSCGGGTGEDVAFFWTAPDAGKYLFNVQSDGGSLALSEFSDSCTGASLSCTSSLGSELSMTLSLEGGNRRILVADAGGGGRVGNYVFSVFRECPNTDLGSALGTSIAMGTTTTARDGMQGAACGPDDGEDFTFTWVVPVTGSYDFTVTSPAHDPVLYLRDGGCEGGLLGCAAGVAGSAVLNVALIGGATTIIVIDGAAGVTGGFTLSIDPT